jgi:hypothetical protein
MGQERRRQTRGLIEAEARVIDRCVYLEGNAALHLAFEHVHAHGRPPAIKKKMDP